MSVYRPPVYGPVPTLEEHLAAPPDAIGATSWLFRPWANAYPYVIRLHVSDGVLVLHGDLKEYHGVRPDALGGEWCLLDLVTGFPCAIGTPPAPQLEWRDHAGSAGASAGHLLLSVSGRPDGSYGWLILPDNLHNVCESESAAKAKAAHFARELATSESARWRAVLADLSGAPPETEHPALEWTDGHAIIAGRPQPWAPPVEDVRMDVAGHSDRWQWAMAVDSRVQVGKADSEAAGRTAAVVAARQHAVAEVKRWQGVIAALGGVPPETERRGHVDFAARASAGDRLADATERLRYCYESDVPDSDYPAPGMVVECPCGECGGRLIAALADYAEAGLEAHSRECAAGIAYGGQPCQCGALATAPPETERERLERALVEVRRSEREWSDDQYVNAGTSMIVGAARALADHIIKEQGR